MRKINRWPNRSILIISIRPTHIICRTRTSRSSNDECVRKLREPLMNIPGVCDVGVDTQRERVIVTFDARKTHAPDLHDAILQSGYKPGAFAD
jgi:copper chaperone CopZ